MAIHLYDGFNVLLRDLDSVTHSRISVRQRLAQADDGNLHIWVFDGARHNERRRAIYPLYKMNREPTPEERFAQIKLFRDALKHTSAWRVCCPTWEGDDVIYTLTTKLKGQITVHSNDGDYCQLEGVHLNGVNKLPCPAEYVALYKALVGDKSDNIKGITGFGPKSWALLESYWGRIQDAVHFRDLAALENIPWPGKALKPWVLENSELLRSMLTITRFIEVPADELSKGIEKGTPNFQEWDAILRRYFL